MNVNENEPLPSTPSNSDIGDQNVERLLGKAYQPETPDSEFVKRVETLMVSAAREGAEARAHESPRVTIARRPVYQWKNLAWSAVAATILVGVGFVVGRQLGRPAGDGLASGSAGTTDLPVALVENIDALALPAVEVMAYRPPPSEQASTAIVGDRGLTPRQRPAAPATEVLEIGNELETDAGQRRRVALADGSVLYLNQNTRVTVEAERQIALRAGEIYVEVAPRLTRSESGTEANKGNEGDSGEGPATFIVKTAGREITALGTKFAVRADSHKADVLVTQGKVQVNDVDQPIAAGQQLAVLKTLDEVGPDKSAPAVTPLPRASHVLDWTRDLIAAAESPLVPASPHAGGSIVARDPNGQEARLSLRKYHVDVHIEDGFARTTIDQTYFNHTSWRLEGTFHFPLPPDGSLSRLAMYVEGKLMEGGMAERNYAREVFEKIVRTQKDPALLEWVDGSTFKMRVFPLEARQEKRIILSYTQRLDTLYGNSKYRFPAGHSLEAVRDWSFHSRVKNGAESTWSCDSHELKQSRNGNDLVLHAEAKEVKLDRDVVLRLTDRAFEAKAADLAHFSSTDHDGQRYLMLRYWPDLPTKAQRQRRDWVFLFESSGDRDPVLARVQVDVIKTLLQNAEHDDTFAILTAGTQVRAFAKELLSATPENVKQAVEFLDGVHLVGALDIGQALAAAEPFVKSGKNAYLVHVGSGMPVLGERSEDKLLKRIPAGARYVGVGVGKRWSRQFMKTAASRTGGYFTQINPDEPVAWRAFDLYSTLNTPRLLNAAVVDHAERAAFLVYNDSIAHGEELCAIARLAAAPGAPGLPKKVTVSGTLDGEPFRRVITVENVAPKADYLPRTWAKLRIDQLLADDAAKHKDEIISLSKAMYVMSPFTSLLVLENEQMYVQFNIDRGRKDHWAMYPCADQIPVVYEPLPSPAAVAKAASHRDPASKKPSVPEVLGTIVIRAPSRVNPRFRLPNSGTWAAERDVGSLDAQRLFEEVIGQLVADSNNPSSLTRGHSLIQDMYRNGSFGRYYFRNEPLGEEHRLAAEVFARTQDFEASVEQARQYVASQPSDYRSHDTTFLGTIRDDGSFLVPSLGYFRPNLSLVVNQSRADDFEYPLSELGVFMSETANWHELLESREVGRRRLLLSRDRWGIRFPDEPAIEYPDSTWWEEMTRRRKTWKRLDLTVPSHEERLGLRRQGILRESMLEEQSQHKKLEDYRARFDASNRLVRIGAIPLDEWRLVRVNGKMDFEMLGNGFSPIELNLQNLFDPNFVPSRYGVDYDVFFGGVAFDQRLKDQQRNYPELQKTFKQARGDAAKYAEQARLYGDQAKIKSDEAVLLWRSEANLRRTQLFLDYYRGNRLDQTVATNRGTLSDLAERIGTAESETPAAKYRAHLQYYSALNEELLRTESQATRTHLQVRAAGTKADKDHLENELAMLNDRAEDLLSELERHRVDLEQMGQDLTGRSLVRTELKREEVLALARGTPAWMSYGDEQQGLIYKTPGFSARPAVFSDLVAYAPGMHTSRADTLAVLDSEAERQTTRPVGDIEPLARAIIDKARGAGWQTLKLSAREGEKPLTIAFDGSGRFGFDRTTEEGLRERVVCDATTLWHLYPELGIGAKRNVSRFHRAEFLSLVPWLLPSVEDLARDADLLAINERTVAIVPRGARPALPRVASGQNEEVEKSGLKLTHFWSIHLIFAEDGRLAERRLVAMPAGKVLARETYAADGTVKMLDGDDKVIAETKLSVEPAAQPDLSPNTKGLVVLPMPVRTVENVYQSSKQARDGRYEQWSEDDALKLLAANMIQDPSAAMQIIGQRFIAKGDRRVGFYTLLMASGLTWEPQGDRVMADGSHVRFDPVADQPDSALARYVFLHQQQMTKSGKIEEMDLAAGPGGGFVEQLAAFRDLHVRWTSGKATGAGDAERRKERERALEFARASKSPLFGWAVLTMVQNHGGDAEFYRALAEGFRTFERTPGLAYAARYESAYCVRQSGDWQKAMELFRGLHAQTLKQGIVPPVDQHFRQAFQSGGNGPALWTALWREAAEAVIARGDRSAALALAWQCHKLGDTAMADELFATTMRGVADKDRPWMTLAAIGYLSQTEQFDRADAMLQPMLEDEEFSQLAWLWRLGAGLAEKHGMTARSVACLDRAMDIEYSRLPEEVDLESARAAFGSLLERYQQLADSIASLQSEPPPDIVHRVIRAADRWRSLDPDDTAACQAAGRVLQRLGVRDAAWEYVTTPLADRPGEAPSWSSLAGTLRGQNEFDLADRAYRSAFDAEPTNAQVLWDHAQLLEQRGQADEARQFYRKIAESSWGSEFQSVQEQARKLVATP